MAKRGVHAIFGTIISQHRASTEWKRYKLGTPRSAKMKDRNVHLGGAQKSELIHWLPGPDWPLKNDDSWKCGDSPLLAGASERR